MIEVGLFIIWSKIRIYEKEILYEINQKFNIKKKYDIHWSKEKFDDNMDAFYGDNLSELFCKRTTIGDDSFLLVIVEDKFPIYGERKTSLGIEKVNINFFDFKWYIRNKFLNGKPFFHGTNNFVEANHDLTLLIGIEDFNATIKQDDNIETLYRDLPCVNGWNNLEEVFYVLNNTINYVVLRDFNKLPYNFHWNDGDIDLLVDNLQSLRQILLPHTNLNKNFFICRFDVKVGNEIIVFHAKYVGDNYFCEQWQKDILLRKVQTKDKIYIPDQEMYFYTLLYHGIVHKNNYKKYQNIFLEYARKLQIPSFNNQVNQYKYLLHNWMKVNQYTYTLHLDIWRGFYKKSILDKNMISNIEDDDIFYYYYPLYGALVFTKKTIIHIPDLVSVLLRKNQCRFPDLLKHKLPKNSKLYKIHKKRSLKGEIMWCYRRLFGKVLRTTYKVKKDKLLPIFDSKERTILYQEPTDIEVQRKVLGLSSKIKTKYLTIKDNSKRVLIAGETVSDILYPVRNDFNQIVCILTPYIDNLFNTFAIKNSNLLKPEAFDALPHNCLLCGNKYIFFDKKIMFNMPIKKTYMLFRICERNHLLINKQALYNYFCSKYNLISEYEFNIIYFDDIVHRNIIAPPQDNLSQRIEKIIKIFSQVFPKNKRRYVINKLRKMFCRIDRKIFKLYFKEFN